MASDPREHWLAAVREDLDAAHNCLYGPKPTTVSAAYHCQQAAEKLVKTALIDQGVHPPKTHDIGRLLPRLADHPLLERLSGLAELTPYATAFRYPSPDPGGGFGIPPTPEEIEEWIATIEALVEALTPPPAR